MARPKKDGLLYFSLDTDFFYADRRIRALKSRFGSDGLILYIYLLAEIYREGYYAGWNTDSIESAMDELGFTEGLIEQVMAFLVSRSLLMKVSILADPDTVITSPGIQRRYQEAAKSLRRDVIVDRAIWLLDEEETAPFIKFAHKEDKSCNNPDKSSKNESKSSKNYVKERKGKERKEKGSGETHAPLTETEYASLVKKYGKETAEYYIRRTRQYKCCSVHKIEEWIAEDRDKKKPEGKQVVNRFNHFPQRNYDFEELEKALNESAE